MSDCAMPSAMPCTGTLRRMDEAAEATALELPPPPPPPVEGVLVALGACLGYESTPILFDVSLAIRPGMRVLLTGSTGAGKSLLLLALSGRVRPLTGARTVGRFVQLLLWNHAAQQSGTIDPASEDTPLDLLMRLGGGDDVTCLATLEAIGIDHLASRRPHASLSSGERTLLMFAALTAAPRHLLLLDEPAAFLGRAAINGLAAAISPERWPGALVFASSSPYCCEAFRPTHIAHIERGHVRLVACPPAGLATSGLPTSSHPTTPVPRPLPPFGGAMASRSTVAWEDDDDDDLDAQQHTAAELHSDASASSASAMASWAGRTDSMAATMAMSMEMLREMGVPPEEAFSAMQTGAAALQSVLNAEHVVAAVAGLLGNS